MHSYRAPPSVGVATTVSTHAVSRSAELLSCAKTAVKIARKSLASGNPTASWSEHYSVSHLRLYPVEEQQSGPQHESLEDGLSLLRTMEGELKQLEALVRRRGHTNDPTEEITLSVRRLEADTSELLQLINVMIPPTARGQRQKHWQMLQKWFQTLATHQGNRLKEILKTRGKVVADQAQRRKQFQPKTATNKAFDQWDSNPLFNLPATRVSRQPPAQGTASAPATGTNGGLTHSGPQAGQVAQSNGTANSDAAISVANPNSVQPRGTTNGYSYYHRTSSAPGSGFQSMGYGGSAGNAAAYAGGYGGGTGTGMRQRRVQGDTNGSQANSNTASVDPQQTLQLRHQARQTQHRVNEARQAERSLAELGTLFGKMSVRAPLAEYSKFGYSTSEIVSHFLHYLSMAYQSLITQQSEVIDKVEDDVEAALVDVAAGQQEITTLYSIKKGNRALIIKTFALLIFFIVFMRFYAK
jgi:hypothetical protein